MGVWEMTGFDLGAHAPAIGCGVVIGILAFAPLALALLPVLRRTVHANMAKGMLGICISFVVLFLGVVVVHLLAHGALVPFLAGELVGFFAGWIAIALYVMMRRD